MTRLLSIITLVLALILSPPAALAVVSNNAVPGDSTYPIKRGLEDVIYAVASLNPNTKALFAKARSDRRFQEITALLTQGKEASKTLNELVEQTQTAANQINQVSDLTQRAKLISQLSDSITRYDQGLLQVSQLRPQASPAVQPSVLTQTPAPAPSVALPPMPDPELERTREELEKIKERLAELERQRQMQQFNQLNQVQSPDQSPSPTPIPSSSPNPSPNPSSSNQNMNRGKINQEIKKDNPKKASDSSQRDKTND